MPTADIIPFGRPQTLPDLSMATAITNRWTATARPVILTYHAVQARAAQMGDLSVKAAATGDDIGKWRHAEAAEALERAGRDLLATIEGVRDDYIREHFRSAWTEEDDAFNDALGDAVTAVSEAVEDAARFGRGIVEGRLA